MQDAPQDALYIWPFHGSLSYAKGLAHKLGRNDLQIEDRSALEERRLRDFRMSSLILDHATQQFMTDAEWRAYEIATRYFIRDHA